MVSETDFPDESTKDFVNQQKLYSFPDAYASSFRVSRDDFIKTRLKHLMQQQQSNHENDNICFRDLMDEYVLEFQAAKTEKVCLGCGAPNDKLLITEFAPTVNENWLREMLTFSVLFQKTTLNHTNILVFRSPRILRL